MRLALAIMALCLSVGCTSEQQPVPVARGSQAAFVTTRAGQRVCAIHRVPLRASIAYGTKDYAPGSNTMIISDPIGERARRVQENPNALPDSESLRRDREHYVPISVTYCPVCQSIVYSPLP